MKVLTAPHQTADPGQLIEVPETLKRTHHIAWATQQCRRYPFGIILKQFFEHKYYTVNIYYCSSDNNVVLYPHFDQPAIALLVFLSGSVKSCHEDETSLELNAGKSGMFSLVYIPAGTHQVQLNSDIIEVCLILLEKEYLAELTEGWPLQEKLLQLINCSSKTGVPYPPALLSYSAKAAIKSMHASDRKGYLLVLELKSCITQLLESYLISIADKMHWLAKAGTMPYKETLLTIREAIKTGPNIHDHTLARLSKAYNIHTKTLRRNFTALFDVNISDFVKEQCMLKACKLLITTGLPFHEIAAMLGYSELTNFNRAFKKRFQMTPGAARAAATLNVPVGL